MIQEDNKQVQNKEENQNMTSTQTTQEEQTTQEQTTQEEQAPTSYAVRPDHRQRRLIDYNGRDKMFKVRNTLNIVFMILAVIGLLLWTQTDYSTLSIVIILVGVVLKIVEVCLRMFKK